LAETDIRLPLPSDAADAVAAPSLIDIGALLPMLNRSWEFRARGPSPERMVTKRIRLILALVVLYGASAGRGDALAAQANALPALIYLSAADCPNCRAFDQSRLPAFVASAEARHVQFREIKRDTLRRPPADGDWPDDLKWVPAAAGGAPKLSATPTFVIVQGDKIVLVASGNRNWDEKVIPMIRQLAHE
jgi:hypothetical protein